jgi:hypothetical protein
MIYGQSSSSDLFVNSLSFSVSSSNKKPKFLDEVKMRLPRDLTPMHHILLTFYDLRPKARTIEEMKVSGGKRKKGEGTGEGGRGEGRGRREEETIFD